MGMTAPSDPYGVYLLVVGGAVVPVASAVIWYSNCCLQAP
jgi:hypothetical protein